MSNWRWKKLETSLCTDCDVVIVGSYRDVPEKCANKMSSEGGGTIRPLRDGVAVHELVVIVQTHPFARGTILIPKPKFYFHGPHAFQCLNIGRPIKSFNARPSNTTLTSTHTQQPIHPSTMDAYNNTFIQKLCNTFNKPPHKWQVDVGAGILRSYNDNTDHNQLLIRKTGEGKSLVYLVTGACLGRVVLCISPLLSLAMDQSRKVLTYTPPTSRIASYHLDKLSHSQLIELQGNSFASHLLQPSSFTPPHNASGNDHPSATSFFKTTLSI